MTIKRITAIMPLDMLESLEAKLRNCGVPGVTVEHVRGYGEHPNYFRRDLMQDNVRLVVYLPEDRVDDIIEALADCARGSGARAGIVAVESTDRLVSLEHGSDIASESL